MMGNLMHLIPTIQVNHLIIPADKLDLINNLNSMKLLKISEAFECFPNESVDVDQVT
jgi:hypothetical protein